MPGVCIATITLARSPSEEALLYESLGSLSRHGIPTLVADGGSREEFTRRIAGIPGIDLAPKIPTRAPRLVSQVQTALAEAARGDCRYILYTEPDKKWFFENRMSDFLATPAEHEGAGMIIASRDVASFGTFPEGQQLTERVTNELCEGVLGIRGDFFYGPLLLHRDLVPQVLEISEEIGWGWRPFAMVVTRKMGLPVVCWEADLPCPEEERGEDDPKSRAYRMEQLAQNARGLALGIKLGLS